MKILVGTTASLQGGSANGRHFNVTNTWVFFSRSRSQWTELVVSSQSER